MTDKSMPTDPSAPTTAKAVWEAPSVEELDFSSTETAPVNTGPDGPYIS